jgi:DNA-binding GntR family transcriptional regulator
VVPNRGARVATWTVAELEGVFDLRSAIEPQLTAYAVPNATQVDVEELDDLAGRMVDVGCPGPARDLDALVPLNRAFHDRLVALADHPTLATALAGAIHPPIVLRNFHAYDPASLQRSLAHHVEIVAALRAGDARWARAVMTAHIHNARAVMVRAATEAAGAEPAAAPPSSEEAS